MKNKRRIYIINKKFQFKYLFIILSVMLISVMAVTFSTFYVVWNSVLNEFLSVPEVSSRLGEILFRTSRLILVPVFLLAAIFTFAGVFLSHKIAGPIYRVERVAEEIGKGNLGIKVKFRKGDDLHHLADSLNKMLANMKGMIVSEKETTQELLEICERLNDDIEKKNNLEEDVKETIIKINNIAKKLKDSTDRYKI